MKIINLHLHLSRLFLRVTRFTPIQAGFTLIELLVVIAVIGVLAGITLVAVNPLEQLARGRDTNRASTIAGLGNSLNTYFAINGAFVTAPTAVNTWMNGLIASNDLKVEPANPTGPGYSTGCNTANASDNGYCYRVVSADAIVYARAESAANITKAGCTGSQVAWIIWSSSAAKTGLICTTNSTTDPTAGAGSATLVNL